MSASPAAILRIHRGILIGNLLSRSTNTGAPCNTVMADHSIYIIYSMYIFYILYIFYTYSIYIYFIHHTNETAVTAPH